MGGGTQPARQAPPPSICVRAGMPLLPFALPHAHAMGRRRTRRHPNRGALKGSGPRPALRVCTTPRAFRVPGPYAPPFACHAHIVPHAGRRAQGGMRKVGCRGRARGTTRGVVRTPPPRRCASRKQRGSNPHRPRPPQMGVRREERCRNGVRTHRSPLSARTPFPSLRLSPFARNEGLGGVQTEGGGVEWEGVPPPLCDRFPTNGCTQGQRGGIRKGGHARSGGYARAPPFLQGTEG